MEVGTHANRIRPKTSRFCALSNFYPDNAIEELYYLEMNYVNNSVNYQHKNNPDYDGKAILRTSFETTKKLNKLEIYLI
jgi:hypothetical protein